MMHRSDTVSFLEELDRRHQSDHDGGYDLVSAINKWLNSLDSESQENVVDDLLEKVLEYDDTLWAVALECLVQQKAVTITARLSQAAMRSGTPQEWTDQVVLALIRLGHLPSLAFTVDHIAAALSAKRLDVLPLLAALFGLERTEALALSAVFFAEALKSFELEQKIRGYIPAFIRNIVKVDDSLLRTLVNRTRSICPASSERLAVMMDEYLTRPFIARHFDMSTINELRQSISAKDPLPE